MVDPVAINVLIMATSAESGQGTTSWLCVKIQLMSDINTKYVPGKADVGHQKVSKLKVIKTRKWYLLGTCEASRFDSNSNRPSDSIRK